MTLKENKIPIYEIYHKDGDKVGVIFDEEIAKKVQQFLNKSQSIEELERMFSDEEITKMVVDIKDGEYRFQRRKGLEEMRDKLLTEIKK